ncbi:nucleotide-binding alpha-beta plait domain-containing protein [Artemisia annua]|uniref:Nucleotide-binding alpha-beta plait domain-containing protein n=1 Tax=Artemisia annua TaxID=35608 RepID=A0A2U1PXN2_ARTAN|nr:nucleotide-binding alpha-beta plait domain-containing protein [Artemisia annua]
MSMMMQFGKQVMTSHLRSFTSASSNNNNKLFVAGLSWSVDEKSLKEAFSSFGQVSEVRIMYDKDSGRSRGFGFVNFSTEDEATSAKDTMDGKALLGRPLRVCFAFGKDHREQITTRQTNIGNTFGRNR